jgi:sugar phosphate isomerase/epimerase
MKKIGLSIGGLQAKFGEERALEICAESGFDSVDIDLSRRKFDVFADSSDDEIITHFTKIKEKADSLGLAVSQTHGRVTSYTPDEEYCEFVRKAARVDLLASSVLGAPTCVIHNITTGRWEDADADFMHAKNKELLDYLVPFAEKYDVNIGMETFGDSQRYGKRVIDFFGDSRELKMQFDMLDTKKKVICMDTGHTNKAFNVGAEDGSAVPDVVESIHMFGKDIKVLHLNDNNGFTDQHLPPMIKMQGGVNWKEVFEALDAVGYDGYYNFELALSLMGESIEEYVHFLGTHLRNCVDGRHW